MIMKPSRNLFIMATIQAVLMLVYDLLGWLYSRYFQLNFAKGIDQATRYVYTLGYLLVFMVMVYCVISYQGFWKQVGIAQAYLLTYTVISLIGNVVLGRLKLLGYYPIALTEWMLFTAFFFLFLGFHRLFLHNKT